MCLGVHVRRWASELSRRRAFLSLEPLHALTFTLHFLPVNLAKGVRRGSFSATVDMARKTKTNGNAVIDMRSFRLVYGDGRSKTITVPGDWRVTFGPIVMTQTGGVRLINCTAVRFYAGTCAKDNLRGVFPHVIELYDQSMLIEHGVAQHVATKPDGDEI